MCIRDSPTARLLLALTSKEYADAAGSSGVRSWRSKPCLLYTSAAFDDVDVDMYLDLVSGEANSIGAVYKAKDDAEAPVDSVRGKEFTIIAITPVLNSPICFNEEAISDDDRTKIIDYFCSDKVANDKAIFIDPEDENAKGLFEKDSELSLIHI